MTPARMLVCTARCGVPLHPAAVAGTRHTTHPGCDLPPAPPKPDRPLATVLPFPTREGTQ